MREPVTEEDFTFITTELTRQSDDLAPALEARLDRARRQAIERGLTRRPFSLTLPLMGRLTLAGAGAALAVLLTLAIQVKKEPVPPPAVAQEVEEFEMMTNQEQMEVVEDQEFYRWLMQQESATIRGEV